MLYMDYVGLFIKFVLNNFLNSWLSIGVFTHTHCNSTKYLTTVSVFYPKKNLFEMKSIAFHFIDSRN